MYKRSELTGVWISDDILACTALSLTEKLLLATISTLSRSSVCYASNPYLSKRFGIPEAEISRAISSLSSMGCIRIESQGNKRLLHYLGLPYCEKTDQPSDFNIKDFNIKDNNKDNIKDFNIKDFNIKDFDIKENNKDNIKDFDIKDEDPLSVLDDNKADNKADNKDAEPFKIFSDNKADKKEKENSSADDNRAAALKALEEYGKDVDDEENRKAIEVRNRARLYSSAEKFSKDEEVRAELKKYIDKRLERGRLEVFELSVMLSRLRQITDDSSEIAARIRSAAERGAYAFC